MNSTMSNKQRGLGFAGFLTGAVVLVIVAITGLKVVPVYMQNQQIKSVFNQIANDPDMQKASLREIRASYERRAAVDYITILKADEIEIVTEGDKLQLSANYSVKIPLAGNVSLYFEFKPHSVAR